MGRFDGSAGATKAFDVARSEIAAVPGALGEQASPARQSGDHGAGRLRGQLVHRYSVLAIIFHWTTALAIAAQLMLGWRMGDASGLSRATLLKLHESIGISILLLTACRLAWRLLNPPPPVHSSLTVLERRVSHAVHLSFYAALFALPITGWVMVSAEQGRGLQLFSLLPWPAVPGLRALPSQAQDRLSDVNDALHLGLVLVMLALIALHVAGALKHHFLSRDPTVSRMAPGIRPGALLDLRWLGMAATVALIAGLAYFVHIPTPPARPAPANLASADLYLDIVGPPLVRRCESCHSDAQSRGGLSVSSYRSLMSGGRDGAVIVPRDPAGSLLLRRMHLPTSDPAHMPRGDRPTLTQDQLTALALWIQAGAPRTAKVASLRLTPAQLAVLGGASGLSADAGREGGNGYDENANLPKVDKADHATVRALEGTGFIVRQIDRDSNLVEVTLTVKRGLTPDDLSRLDKIGQQILRLNLQRSGLTDQQLKTVATFAHIRRLRLDDTGVTDTGIAELASMKALASVSVTNTKATDAGLAALTKLQSLHELYLWGTGTTAEGRRKLKAALPQVAIREGLSRADVPPPGPLRQPVN